MDREEARQRDGLVQMVRGNRKFVEVLRDMISSRDFLDHEAALGIVDEIFGAMTQRLEELFHGDLSEQFERVMLEPSRTDLQTAVVEAGVGGTVTQHLYNPGDLDRVSREYQVLKINRCSVRLRSRHNLAEKLKRFDAERGWERDSWSVTEAVSWPGRGQYQAARAQEEAERQQREQQWRTDFRAATGQPDLQWPDEM